MAKKRWIKAAAKEEKATEAGSRPMPKMQKKTSTAVMGKMYAKK